MWHYGFIWLMTDVMFCLDWRSLEFPWIIKINCWFWHYGTVQYCSCLWHTRAPSIDNANWLDSLTMKPTTEASQNAVQETKDIWGRHISQWGSDGWILYMYNHLQISYISFHSENQSCLHIKQGKTTTIPKVTVYVSMREWVPNNSNNSPIKNSAYTTLSVITAASLRNLFYIFVAL